MTNEVVVSEQTMMAAEILADALTDITTEHGREREMLKVELNKYIASRGFNVDSDVVEYLITEGYVFLAELVNEIVSMNNLHPELKKLAELEVGKEYTFLTYGEFGFAASMKIKLEDVQVVRYAQYPSAIRLTFKSKNKRYEKNSRFMYILPYQTFIVWNGHREIDTNMWSESKVSKLGTEYRESKGRAFDSIHIDDALKSVEIEPVVMYRPR